MRAGAVAWAGWKVLSGFVRAGGQESEKAMSEKKKEIKARQFLRL